MSQVISDGSEVQFGRITKSGMRDRYIARPPLLPGQKCTELDLPNSPDTRDQQPCPQECQPLPYKESQLSHMSHQVQNIDQSPPLWLGDTPPVRWPPGNLKAVMSMRMSTCASATKSSTDDRSCCAAGQPLVRPLGGHSRLPRLRAQLHQHGHLAQPAAALVGRRLPLPGAPAAASRPSCCVARCWDPWPQVVEQKYLYELDHMNMGDHFKTWDLRPSPSGPCSPQGTRPDCADLAGRRPSL